MGKAWGEGGGGDQESVVDVDGCVEARLKFTRGICVGTGS